MTVLVVVMDLLIVMNLKALTLAAAMARSSYGRLWTQRPNAQQSMSVGTDLAPGPTRLRPANLAGR